MENIARKYRGHQEKPVAPRTPAASVAANTPSIGAKICGLVQAEEKSEWKSKRLAGGFPRNLAFKAKGAVLVNVSAPFGAVREVKMG